MELYLDTCVLYSLKVTEIFIHPRLMFYEVLADLRLYSINASQNSFNTLVNTFAWKLMPSVLFAWVSFEKAPSDTLLVALVYFTAIAIYLHID